MSDLNAQIARLERDVAELERLERARAELPELRAERERLEREEAARVRMARASELSRQAIADRMSSVESWRERFAQVLEDVRSLARELESIERPVSVVAEQVAGAVRNCENVGIPTQNVERVWVGLGWHDERLAVFEDRYDGRAFRTLGLDERLVGLLQDEAGVRILRPGSGIRQYIGSRA